jgi:site-specific DNA-methyltransferase (adenine-specific)
VRKKENEAASVPVPGTVYVGDCLDVMAAWPDGSVDCCITDPPYNMSNRKGLAWAFSSHVTMQEKWDRFSKDEYFRFTARWLEEACRVVRPNGNVLVFGSFHNIYLIGFVLQYVLQRRLMQQITWFKPNAQPNITGRLLTESTEYILWACNNTEEDAKGWTFNYEAAKRFNGGKQLRNMWSMPYTPASEKEFGTHPTQKPLEVVERIVSIFTSPEHFVLDCFLGTGTTAVACEKLGRKFVGIERDSKYVETSKKRLAHVQKELVLGYEKS